MKNIQRVLAILIISIACLHYPPNDVFANENPIEWSQSKEDVYSPLHPYVLNWSGDILQDGGMDLDTMVITKERSKVDFVINQYGTLGADQIYELDQSAFGKPLTLSSLPTSPRNSATLKQGGVYLISMDDGRYAQLRIDRLMLPTKVMFSYAIEGKEVELESLQVSESDMTLKVGENKDLSATAVFSDGTQKDVTAEVQWKTSNPDVISISNAKIVALQPGKSTITASFANKTTLINITVVEDSSNVFELIIDESNFNLEPGSQIRFEVFKKYKDGRMENVTNDATYFSSSRSNVTIVPGFLVVPETAKIGSYQVTISYEGKNIQLDVNVSTLQLDKLMALPAITTLEIGEKFEINLKGKYNDASIKDVTTVAEWFSDDPRVAQVNGGEINALSAGYAKITANYEGKETTVHVYVNPARTVQTLEISERNVKIVRGDHIQPMVYATFNKGGKERILHGIVWQSRNNSVASVNSLGVITGKITGSTTIEATFGGKSVMFNIQVVAEKAVVSLEADRTNIQIGVDDKWPIRINATFEDGSKEDVTDSVVWGAKIASIANVNNSGLVVANGVGSTEIVATYRGKTLAVEVEVLEALTKTKPINSLPWEEKQASAKQAWTVKFNTAFDTNTINTNNVYITDENGRVIPVYLNTANGGKDLIITPVDSFNPTASYYLNITTDVRSITGNTLNKAIVMKFTIN